MASLLHATPVIALTAKLHQARKRMFKKGCFFWFSPVSDRENTSKLTVTKS